MKMHEPYDRWVASKQVVDIPEAWADSVMQRIDRYEASRRGSPFCAQAWVDWFGTCLPARATLVLAGALVCVTRFIVLFLATLG